MIVNRNFISLPEQRKSLDEQNQYSEPNIETSLPADRGGYDNSSKSQDNLTDVQISSPVLKISKRENQTNSKHSSNTYSQKDVSNNPPPPAKSSQTNVIQNRGIGVQTPSIPSKISVSHPSDTQTKITGPPLHLIKKIKNRSRKIEKTPPQIHENMNVPISPVIKNKKQKQSLAIHHLRFKDRRII